MHLVVVEQALLLIRQPLVLVALPLSAGISQGSPGYPIHPCRGLRRGRAHHASLRIPPSRANGSATGDIVPSRQPHSWTEQCVPRRLNPSLTVPDGFLRPPHWN